MQRGEGSVMDRPASSPPIATDENPDRTQPTVWRECLRPQPILMVVLRYHCAQAAVPSPGDGHQGSGRLPPSGARAVPRAPGQTQCGQVEPRAARHRQSAWPAGRRQGTLRLRGHRTGPSFTASTNPAKERACNEDYWLPDGAWVGHVQSLTWSCGSLRAVAGGEGYQEDSGQATERWDCPSGAVHVHIHTYVYVYVY